MSRIGELRHSLVFKVAALIVGILIACFSTLFLLSVQRDTEVQSAKHVEGVRLLALSIVTSIENGMIEGRPDIIRRLVHEMQSELRELRRLGVYRRNGVEAFMDLETLEEVDTVMGLDPDLISRISKMRQEPGEKISHPLFEIPWSLRKSTKGQTVLAC